MPRTRLSRIADNRVAITASLSLSPRRSGMKQESGHKQKCDGLLRKCVTVAVRSNLGRNVRLLLISREILNNQACLKSFTVTH
jgi:hypothetical protein